MATRPAQSSDHVLGLSKLRGRGVAKEVDPITDSSLESFENSVVEFKNPVQSELGEESKDSTSGVLGGASGGATEAARSQLSQLVPLENDILGGILDAFGGGQEFAMEGNALGFIPETNPVRKAIFLLLHNPLVDVFIIICIGANCIILYFQVPGVRALRTDSFNSTCEWIDLVITTVFTVEVCLKIICLGFIRGHHAYLKNSWNVLDFVLGLDCRGRPARFTGLKTLLAVVNCISMADLCESADHIASNSGVSWSDSDYYMDRQLLRISTEAHGLPPGQLTTAIHSTCIPLKSTCVHSCG